MEKEQKIKSVRKLHDFGTKSHDIAWMINLLVDEVDEIRDDYVGMIGEIEDDYWEYEWPKMQEGIREWIKDIPESERVAMRRDQLLSEVRDMKKTPLNPALPRLLQEAKLFTGRIEGVNPADVLRARDYPISQLMTFKHRIALCIWHTEKTPSLHLYPTNTVHCFGCDKTGDAIDVCMQLTNCSFKEALSKLI